MKQIWKSKTIWVNVFGLADLFLDASGLDVQTKAAILTIANVGLRLITKEPINLGGR